MQNYRLLEEVGTGSYSVVYRAEDLRNGSIVAVKVMKFFYSHARKLQDTELVALKLFQNCPCVVRLLDHFIEEDVMVLVFELGGATLLQVYQELRNQQYRFTEKEIKLVSYQVAVALAEVHSKRFMHRDLKPENILLKRLEGNVLSVKLVDFGMCRRRLEVPSEELTGYVTTRWYRAPEVILSLPYDMKLDVFSLGSVMLELFLGYEAFPGADAIDQLNRIFSVTGTPSKEQWPEGMGLLEQKKIQFPQYKKLDLAKHMPEVSLEAIELVQRMVECNPKRRIAMIDVIQHSYFKDIFADEELPKGVREVAERLIAMSKLDESSRLKLEHAEQQAEKYCQLISNIELPRMPEPPVQPFAEKYLNNCPTEQFENQSPNQPVTTARKKKLDLTDTNNLNKTKSKNEETEQLPTEEFTQLSLL